MPQGFSEKILKGLSCVCVCVWGVVQHNCLYAYACASVIKSFKAHRNFY